MKKYIPTEADEQEAVIRWAKLSEGKYPELKLLHHIPNGGSRHPAEAAHLKRQGVKAGVPDLHLPVARNGYNSLYIEMKRADKSAKPTTLQKQWGVDLTAEGNKWICCHGAEEAIEALKEYLEIK